MLRKFILPALMAFAFAGNASALTGKGKFDKKTHKVKGTWFLLEVEGQQVISFSKSFKTKEGPALEILLSKKSIDDLDNSPTFTDAIAFARLKNASGEQHYVLPAEINIEDYESLVIHCGKNNLIWGGFDMPDKDFLEDQARQAEEDDIARVIENNEGAIRVGL